MPEISDVIRMSPELKAGIRHARRLALTGERDEMKLTTMERSLELAMGAVSALWDSFDGDELRDALVRLVRCPNCGNPKSSHEMFNPPRCPVVRLAFPDDATEPSEAIVAHSIFLCGHADCEPWGCIHKEGPAEAGPGGAA